MRTSHVRSYNAVDVPQAAGSPVRSMALVALFGGLIAALAFVSVPLPFSPVPVTGQTLGVMMAGLLLGPGLGAAAAGIYILLGFVGLPVFSGGAGGLSALAGPTGGYILGFAAGAWAVGASYRALRGRAAAAFWAAFIGGVLVVYGFGLPYLKWRLDLTWAKAFTVGALPFLPGDIFKAFVAGVIAPRILRSVR